MILSAPAQRSGRSPRTNETILVALVVLSAAVGAAVSGAAPTGTPGWDHFLNASVAAMVVIAASKAPRWTVLVMATAVSAASFTTVWAFAAWAGLVLGVVSVLLERRSRTVGAVAAALAVQAALRLPSFGFFGFQSLLVLAVFSLVIIFGYRYGTRRARRWSRLALLGVSLVTVLVVIVGAAALIGARTDVDRGVSAARRGLQAARNGDTAQVALELGEAERSLGTAQSRVSGPTARALRLVPIVAQQQRAVEAATGEGARVAGDASSTMQNADISSISLDAGAVDLETLRDMAPQLRATAISLQNALVTLDETDSPWLLPALRDRIVDLGDEIGGLLPEVDLGAAAAENLPAMLGIDTQQTYFVMFGTPAESRELGGLLGSWALVSFDDGRLQLGESGRINELYALAQQADIVPGTVSDWFIETARPTQFPQNLTSSPDFAVVAEVSRQVLGGASAEPIAGFVYLDAVAIAALLELTGPVQVPLRDAPLTAANSLKFFLDEQYRIDVSRNDVFDTLSEVAGTVVARITEQTLPGPERLGQVLGPAARGGHLQVITFDGGHNEFLRSVKLLRDFGRQDTADFVALVQANGRPNKLDQYLTRSLDYDIDVTPEGMVTATATVVLTSVVPADVSEFVYGRPEDGGENEVVLSLYTPHVLQRVLVDGEVAEVRSAAEFDLARYAVEVRVPPNGQPVVIEFDLVGALETRPSYSIEVWHQPLVQRDAVSISYSGDDGMISWDGSLVENTVLVAEPLAE